MLPDSDSRLVVSTFLLPPVHPKSVLNQALAAVYLLLTDAVCSHVCRLLEQLMQIVCLLPGHVGVSQSSSHSVSQSSSETAIRRR